MPAQKRRFRFPPQHSHRLSLSKPQLGNHFPRRLRGRVRTVRFRERSAVSRRSGSASSGKYAPSARDPISVVRRSRTTFRKPSFPAGPMIGRIEADSWQSAVGNILQQIYRSSMQSLRLRRPRVWFPVRYSSSSKSVNDCNSTAVVTSSLTTSISADGPALKWPRSARLDSNVSTREAAVVICLNAA